MSECAKGAGLRWSNRSLLVVSFLQMLKKPRQKSHRFGLGRVVMPSTMSDTEHEPRVNFVMTQEKRRLVSVTDRACISRDRVFTERVWSECWEVWLFDGRTIRHCVWWSWTPKRRLFGTHPALRETDPFSRHPRLHTHQRQPSDRDDKRAAHVKLQEM